jgi:hypothetical protein
MRRIVPTLGDVIPEVHELPIRADTMDVERLGQRAARNSNLLQTVGNSGVHPDDHDRTAKPPTGGAVAMSFAEAYQLQEEAHQDRNVMAATGQLKQEILTAVKEDLAKKPKSCLVSATEVHLRARVCERQLREPVQESVPFRRNEHIEEAHGSTPGRRMVCCMAPRLAEGSDKNA